MSAVDAGARESGSPGELQGSASRGTGLEPQRLGPPDIVLVRYGELSLKGGNRREFEQTLVRNMRAALEPISPVKIERSHGRLAVFPERRTLAVAKRLTEVFGISSVSPAWSTPSEPEKILDLARLVFHFDRRSIGRLRQLIDRLNGLVVAPREGMPATPQEVIAGAVTPEQEAAEEAELEL